MSKLFLHGPLAAVEPYVLDLLGYSARDHEAIAKLRSAGADEPGYLIRVTRIHALGYQLRDFRVHAHDLPEGYGIDGLLGLDLPAPFKFEVDCGQGRIFLTALAPGG